MVSAPPQGKTDRSMPVVAYQPRQNLHHPACASPVPSMGRFRNNPAQTRMAALPPVTPAGRLSSSPTQETATRSRVYPTNQLSRLSLVVPVFPAIIVSLPSNPCNACRRALFDHPGQCKIQQSNSLAVLQRHKPERVTTQQLTLRGQHGCH